MSKFWKNNPKWKAARDVFENPPISSGMKKCTLRASCACCRDSDDFGGVCQDFIETANERVVQVIVCYNKSSNYAKTLAHEVMHYFDKCSNRFGCDTKLPPQDVLDCLCRNNLCKEYRAFFITGECTDPDTCWDRIVKKNFKGGYESYWEESRCSILAGKDAKDQERIKNQLKLKCSLTEGMPPKPEL